MSIIIIKEFSLINNNNNKNRFDYYGEGNPVTAPNALRTTLILQSLGTSTAYLSLY